MEWRMRSQRSWINSFSPAPSRTMVSFLSTSTFLHVPKCSAVTCSSFMPVSSEMTVPPVSRARSCMVDLRLSPKPGALTAQTLIPARSLLTTSVARASLSTSSATIRRDDWLLMTFSSSGTSCWRLLTFFSTRRIIGFSSTHFWVLASVMKYGLMYPRSNFIPSTTSSSFSKVFPSWHVMTPSFPTRSMASEMSCPISVSALAEMVPTCVISSLEVIGRLISSRLLVTLVTAIWIPRRKSCGFNPAATALQPSEKMARARTVAVVVPSPAISLVLEATLLMS
mmetsp:Transcript_8289/g.22469  ORF Transcript_8289/g.22469 Transcript_8289/m.22469 type:complete len:282 (-) Transcript_8289:161-1006(-)